MSTILRIVAAVFVLVALSFVGSNMLGLILATLMILIAVVSVVGSYIIDYINECRHQVVQEVTRAAPVVQPVRGFADVGG